MIFVCDGTSCAGIGIIIGNVGAEIDAKSIFGYTQSIMRVYLTLFHSQLPYTETYPVCLESKYSFISVIHDHESKTYNHHKW